MNANNMQSICLLQLKLYLKIVGILYFLEGMNTSIDASFMENIIKTTHIFNNI